MSDFVVPSNPNYKGSSKKHKKSSSNFTVPENPNTQPISNTPPAPQDAGWNESDTKHISDSNIANGINPTNNISNTDNSIVPTNPNAISPTTTVKENTPDINEIASEIESARKRSAIAAFKKARDESISNLDEQESTIEPEYYDRKNEVAASNDVGALNFAQYMAGKGVRGKQAALPEIYRNNALQRNLGELNQAEAQEKANIARNRANINNAYEQDVASASDNAKTQALEQAIAQYNTEQQYKLAAENQAFNQNLASKQYADEATATEKQDYLNNIGQFYNDYQAEINNIKNDNDTSNDWQIALLQAARQKKLRDLQTATEEKTQQDFENSLKQQETNYNTNKPYYKETDGSSGLTKTEQNNQSYGEDYQSLKSLSYDGAIAELTNNAAAYISQYGASGYKSLWNDVLADAIAEGYTNKK
jgi:hypothetical protein